MNETKRKKIEKRTIAIPHQSHLIEFDVKWYKYNTPVGQSCSQNKVNIHSIYTGIHSYTHTRRENVRKQTNKQTHTHIPIWRLYWQAGIHTRSLRWTIEFKQLTAAWLPAASSFVQPYTPRIRMHTVVTYTHSQWIESMSMSNAAAAVAVCDNKKF